MQSSNSEPKSSSSIFAVFPGQGSQHVGMGKDLYQQFAIAREVFEEASDSIVVNLKKLCFDGPDSDLTLTENTQPCLLASSVAAFRVAQRELDFKPGAVAGHSLGEYSALVSIGAFPLSAATQWVRERGLAMQKAVPKGEGTMAAILGLEDEQVTTLCKAATELARQKRTQIQEEDAISVDALAEPANFNAPGQVVIAGSIDAIQEAIALIKSGEFPGGKAIPLQVSAPFHCKLMLPARDRMEEIFSLVSAENQPKTSFCSYVPNRTARFNHEAGVIFQLLIEQVDHPVLWKQSVLTFLNSGYSKAVEFGPGKVLGGLIKRIASSHSKTCVQTQVGDANSLKNLENFLKISE